MMPGHTPRPHELDAGELALLARESRWLFVAWVATLVLVLGGAFVWTELTTHASPHRIWIQIFGLVTFPGKYLIFAGLSQESPLRPHEIAVLGVCTDVGTSLSIAVFLGLLLRVGWIARTLFRARNHVHDVLEQFPRLRRMAFMGVVLFVFLPLPASGSVGGSFLGQVLGLSRSTTVVAVAVGGALVASVFTGLCVFFGARGQDMYRSPWVTGTSAVVFVAFAFWAWTIVKRTLRRPG